MEGVVNKIEEFKECYKCISVKDKLSVFNIDLFYKIEFGFILDVV